MPMGEGAHRRMEKRIVVIGAGNVAAHLAPSLKGVVQVYSRHIENAEALAESIGCHATDSLRDLADADVYIVAVKDDAIAAIAKAVPERCRHALWLHTSGSVDKSVFADGFERYGVLYPLQTFSKSVELDMHQVPLFIEGSDAEVEGEIRRLALTVSPTVVRADSHLRMQMHVAAVFACNFSNYMYTLADEVLRRNGLEFALLKPLLTETLHKAVEASPEASQTGPAARGDRGVIAKHESLLDGEQLDIYKTVTNAIIKHYNK